MKKIILVVIIIFSMFLTSCGGSGGSSEETQSSNQLEQTTRTESITYDTAGRVVKEEVTNKNDIMYQYDESGNIISMKVVAK